jgi:3-oxoacyl-[acyl-carrier protein] reductase
MIAARPALREGRVVIVTGGSRGIGRETIRRLANLGYAVVVNYIHDQQTAESTVEAVLERRGAAVAIRADVADELDAQRLFDQTIEAFGAVDAVVHTVRGHVTAAPVAELGLDDFDSLCRMNLRATLIVNRAAARHVRDGGAIVNLSSSPGRLASPAHGPYATTAAAIDALTRMLAVDLRERDITVTGVSLDADKAYAPDRVADVIVYLLSDDGRGISGQVIHVDDRPR